MPSAPCLLHGLERQLDERFHRGQGSSRVQAAAFAGWRLSFLISSRSEDGHIHMSTETGKPKCSSFRYIE